MLITISCGQLWHAPQTRYLQATHRLNIACLAERIADSSIESGWEPMTTTMFYRFRHICFRIDPFPGWICSAQVTSRLQLLDASVNTLLQSDSDHATEYESLHTCFVRLRVHTNSVNSHTRKHLCISHFPQVQ